MEEAKESILQIELYAALALHDLGPFDPAQDLTMGRQPDAGSAANPPGLETLD